MRFSIIIATLNRVKELELMLNSLKNQTFNDFEVIVVDQNEKEVITDIINRYKKRFKLIHIRVPAQGASNARNNGIKVAEGDIITFPDDDCEYPIDFLFNVEQCFKENVEDGIVVNTMDRKDGKAIAKLSSSTVEIQRSNILKTVIEAGIFIKSKAAEGVFFDENLGVGSSSGYCSDEGPDFVLKLLERGVRMKFYPNFKMFHPNPVYEYNEKAAKRAYSYGKGRGYFLRKNGFGYRGIFYSLFLYCLGMTKGLVTLDFKMFKYYKSGFKGRYQGYFK